MTDATEKLERVSEVIGLTLTTHGGKMQSKTRLINLLYLIDLHFARNFGSPLTGLEYRSYFYGPYPESIDSVLEYLRSSGFLKITQEKDAETGRLYYTFKLLDLPQFGRLTVKEKEEIRKIASQYVYNLTDDILEKVYETKEYIKTPFGEVINFGGAL